MPRALLLKKPKFKSSDCGCVSKRPSTKVAGTSLRNYHRWDKCYGKVKPSVSVKITTSKRKKIFASKQSKQLVHNYDSDNLPVRNCLLRNISVKLINSQTEEENTEDEENEYNGQEHYVKWMKKDGKTRKVWECGICRKEFVHQYTLMRHLPIHTDERNFKCDVCGKAFRQASTLCRHKAIHSDARPFLCNVCGKAFNRSSTLIAHRKTHSEMKPHTCHVCGKGFHQKGNLKNHVYTHTGERPYKCDKCERGFNQMSNLMCHKAHAHVEKPKHCCHLCGKEFAHTFSLRTHEEYKHGIKYDVTGEQHVAVENKYRELLHHQRGRPANGNTSKTVTLPNGDKTIKFLNASDKTQCLLGNVSKLLSFDDVSDKDPKESVNIETVTSMKTMADNMSDHILPSVMSVPLLSKSTGILIDSITLPAISLAQENGQTPFALLTPAKGIPVLVKILPTSDGKQVLVSATADDLKNLGKVCASFEKTGNNTLHVKVPLVANISQKVSPNGQLIIEMEPITNTYESQQEKPAEVVLNCDKTEKLPESSKIEEKAIETKLGLHTSQSESTVSLLCPSSFLIHESNELTVVDEIMPNVTVNSTEVVIPSVNEKISR